MNYTEQLLKLAAKKKPKGTATKRDPKKWAAAKSRAKAKMGGKWSARAAQLAVKYYKDAGGKYKGKKPTAKNNKLKKWTKQDWQWSGDRKKKSSVNDSLVEALIEFSKEAGKKKKKKKKGKGVYLPAKAIDALKSSKKGRKKLRAASRKKAKATREGKQHASHGLHKGKKRSKLGEEKLKVLDKLQEYLSNKGVKTSSYKSPYMQAYEVGVKLATAEFEDYSSMQDPDGYDSEELRADVEDPKDFRSKRYREAQTPATNNYADPKAKSNFAKQPPEVTPDQTFGTNYPKRDRLRGKYNG